MKHTVCLLFLVSAACSLFTTGPDSISGIYSKYGFRFQVGDYSGEITQAHAELADRAWEEVVICLGGFGFEHKASDTLGRVNIRLREPQTEQELIYCGGELNGGCYSRDSHLIEVPGNYPTTTKKQYPLQPLKHEFIHHLFYGKYGRSEAANKKHDESYWSCQWQ